MAPADFDKEFDAFVRSRYGALLAAMNEWQSAVSGGAQGDRRASSGTMRSNRRSGRLSSIPSTSGPAVRICCWRARSTNSDAAQRRSLPLEAYRNAGGWDPAALRELARWLDEAGRKQDATAVLQSLNYADPLNPEQHVQLGERLLADRPRRRFPARVPRAARVARS